MPAAEEWKFRFHTVWTRTCSSWACWRRAAAAEGTLKTCLSELLDVFVWMNPESLGSPWVPAATAAAAPWGRWRRRRGGRPPAGTSTTGGGWRWRATAPPKRPTPLKTDLWPGLQFRWSFRPKYRLMFDFIGPGLFWTSCLLLSGGQRNVDQSNNFCKTNPDSCSQ